MHADQARANLPLLATSRLAESAKRAAYLSCPMILGLQCLPPPKLQHQVTPSTCLARVG